MSLPRREAATVGAFQIIRAYWWRGLCDETDPGYKLRFDADEECVRELIGSMGCRFVE